MCDDCIFCKIAANEIPSTRVYEDEKAIAFMDIAPIAKGHTLVIPKIHADPITEVDNETLAHLIVVVKKVTEGVMKALNADGINVTQANGSAAGQVVPHIHFHIIPRFDSDGKSHNWSHTAYSDNDEMAAFAEKIKESISDSGSH